MELCDLFLFLLVLIFIFIVLIIVFCFWKRPTKKDEMILDYVRRMYNDLAPQYNVKVGKANSAYTVNKKKVYLCLQYNGKYYDKNTISFVALHELAHVIDKKKTINDEHTDQFNIIFTFLLDKAEQKGYFDKNKPISETYCGIKQ